jgi:hypothetical protein
MMKRARSKRRRFLLGAVLATLALCFPAGAGARSGPSGDLIAGSEESALRLHDLPPGYQLGDDGGCGPSIPAGEEGEPKGRLQKRLLKWTIRYWPEGCSYQYEQVFKVPGLGPAPPLVEVEVLNTPSEQAATEGFNLIKALVRRYEPEADQGTVTLSPSGIEARHFRNRNFLVDGKAHQAGSVLIWHHGKLIGYVEVAGWKPRRNDRAVLHYAQIQQGRMERPSPYTEEERDDKEVWLDNPALRFPIYWIGRAFDPAAGAPVELEYAYAGTPGPPGVKFELEYDEFGISGWTRRSWRRFQPTVLGRLNLNRACVRKTRVDLAQGQAVVYAGYGRRHLRRCPSGPPDDYWAIAHLGRMVIGVNLTLCTGCLGASSGPEASLAGMKEILSALQVRPKPDFAAESASRSAMRTLSRTR